MKATKAMIEDFKGELKVAYKQMASLQDYIANLQVSGNAAKIAAATQLLNSWTVRAGELEAKLR